MTTMNATYSPEDNKLRLYASSRLDRETYDRVKAAGFKWAPKQELFVAPAWSPRREDLLIELAGEIGDEDTSLVERSEERAERFTEYSDKRMGEAEQAREHVARIADGIPFGQPILVGHHSERHARKDAERIQNGMRKAVNLWQTSKYWTDRAKGAIGHAKYKELPAVRARRIKGIEADKRKAERGKLDAERSLSMWRKVETIEQARAVANLNHLTVYCPEGNSYGYTAWDVLRPDEERYRDCPAWTVEQVKAIAEVVYPKIIARCERWIAHYENRLTYERAMLAESGGIATDRVAPEKGGACRCWMSHRGGYSYIIKVNKVSVSVLRNWGNGGRNFACTVPFDKLTSLMTAAQVQQTRDDSRLVEFEDKTGFFLKDSPIPEPRKPEAKAPNADVFEALREAAKAGVQVISAPQLFPTPMNLARRVVELAEIRNGDTVLEPSAGTGNLIHAILENEPGATVNAVEINLQLADSIRSRFFDGRFGHQGVAVQCCDFLQQNGNLGTFDRIVMNPPFANDQDIAHVRHAWEHLKEGGRLVAIMSPGFTFGMTRARMEFREFVDSNGEWETLPDGSFADAGTNVRTVLVKLNKEHCP